MVDYRLGVKVWSRSRGQQIPCSGRSATPLNSSPCPHLIVEGQPRVQHSQRSAQDPLNPPLDSARSPPTARQSLARLAGSVAVRSARVAARSVPEAPMRVLELSAQRNRPQQRPSPPLALVNLASQHQVQSPPLDNRPLDNLHSVSQPSVHPHSVRQRQPRSLRQPAHLAASLVPADLQPSHLRELVRSELRHRSPLTRSLSGLRMSLRRSLRRTPLVRAVHSMGPAPSRLRSQRRPHRLQHRLQEGVHSPA